MSTQDAEQTDEPTTSTDQDGSQEDTQEDSGPVVDVKALASEVETLGIATEGDPDGLGAIVAGLLDGEIPPEAVDEEIRAWLNDQIDIPFIGEASEAVLLRQVQRVVKSALVGFLRSL